MFDEGRVIGTGCPRQASVGYSVLTEDKDPSGEESRDSSNFREL